MNLKNQNLYFLPSIKRKFNLLPWAFSFSTLALFIILQSCTPIREVAPQNTKTEMLLKAKSLFKQKAEASAARKSAANSRDIDVASLFPEWDNNRLTKSLDEKQIDVLQVFIKKNADQFWSLDYLTLNDTQIIRIRKYTKHDGCLTIYDVDGRFLEKGNYDPVKGTYAPFLTRENLSRQARIASNVEFIRDGDEWIVIWDVGNVHYATRIPVNTGEIGGNIDGPWNQGNGSNNGNNGNNGSTGNGDGNNESGGSGSGYIGINDIKTNNISKPCLLSAVNSAITPSLLNKISQKIVNVFSSEGVYGGEPFDLVFVEEEHVISTETQQEVHARTSQENIGGKVQMTIHLNSSTLPGTTSEFQKMTILHELIHAYIKYYQGRGQYNNTPSHEIMASEPLFSNLKNGIMELTGITDTTTIAALSLYGLRDARESSSYQARIIESNITSSILLNIGDLYEKVIYDQQNNVIKVGGDQCL